MPEAPSQSITLDPQTRAVYQHTLKLLRDAQAPFLVGGAYAFERYTGIARHTKDFDIFVRREDYDDVAQVLANAGYRTELTFPHWLGKAFSGEECIDIIFSSANGKARVDEAWFTHAVTTEVFEQPVSIIPAEEMILSKSFILERERCDIADVMHVLRAQAAQLDWPRLLERFGAHWRVLLSHVVLFGFVYPDQRAQIPEEIVNKLIQRFQEDLAAGPSDTQVCYGTLISREQYLIDVHERGYQDGRQRPYGTLTAEEIAQWTDSIGKIE